jgi:hypothetical protein
MLNGNSFRKTVVRFIFPLAASLFIIIGCRTHYLDYVFETDEQVHSLTGIEQTISIPFTIQEVTRTSLPTAFHLLRFRLNINGITGDAKIAEYTIDYYVSVYLLYVQIPENTSGHERTITVEISKDEEWGTNPENPTWKDWETIYKATQSSL